MLYSCVYTFEKLVAFQLHDTKQPAYKIHLLTNNPTKLTSSDSISKGTLSDSFQEIPGANNGTYHTLKLSVGEKKNPQRQCDRSILAPIEWEE